MSDRARKEQIVVVVLKICLNEWKNASRDKKELSACRELGGDVKVIAKGNHAMDYGQIEDVDGFKVYRMTTRPWNHVPVSVNRIISIFVWAKYARRMKPDIISGHDLGGLVIGWLSTLFLRADNKPKLVYDSHEFELGRNAKRNKARIFIIALLERFMIKRSSFMIVVNDSIADEVTRIHRLKKRPVVVRNIPSRWTIDEEICADTRQQLLQTFNVENGYILMYHGAVVNGRGIEKCIEILAFDEQLCLVILGNALSENYKKQLQEYINKIGVRNRVMFHEAVPLSELWKYIGAVDISMAIVEPIARSYYLSLPNKLFEGIQAHTPIVGSELPEIKKIIENYGVGNTCDPNDVRDIYRAVKEIKDSKAKQKEYRRNAEEASKELCWEVESERLKTAYKGIWKSS